MWTGDVSLRSIHTYLSGYEHALSDLKVIPSSLAAPDPFFDWVANKLGYYESTAGWANMILAYSMGFEPRQISWNEFLEAPVTKDNHLKSIELFYQLLEAYRQESEK